MKHVLGVAFPHAELDGPRCGELELQFLRLSYAVHRLAQSGVDARGYFVVLRQEIRDRVLRLKADYGAGDNVRVVFASLLVSEMTALVDAAELARKAGDEASAESVRRTISVNVLRREIASQEPGVIESTLPEAMPFGVAWDYHGTVRSLAGEPDEALPGVRSV
ncbi:MAG: hypothetical protein M0R22_02275 [Dehalococcoidia bacterium]|nr:hypothetical protein [Dehalococcoidia bacterium]